MRKTLSVKELYEFEAEKTIKGKEAIKDTELIDHIKEETELIHCEEWEYIGHKYDLTIIPDDFPIEVKYLKRHCFDGRRTWVLAIGYWKETPFIIYKNYGRDNDEYTESYITNYKVMDDFVDNLNKYRIIETHERLDIKEDKEILIEFYGANLLDKNSFCTKWGY